MFLKDKVKIGARNIIKDIEKKIIKCALYCTPKREQASEISGGMFLLCGVSLASNWLHGYGHCVPVPVL